MSLGMKSCAALARRAGLSVNYVSMLERGDRRPRWETATVIARALELDDSQTAHLFRLVDAGAKPDEIRDATLASELPVGSIWYYVPSLAVDVLWDKDKIDIDDAIGFGVPLLSAAATWATLQIEGVGDAALSRYRNAALQYHDDRATALGSDGGRYYPDLLFALTVAFKHDLFGAPRVARKTIGLVEGWGYSEGTIDLALQRHPQIASCRAWHTLDPLAARKLFDYRIGLQLLSIAGLTPETWNVATDTDMDYALPNFPGVWEAIASERTWPNTDPRVIGYSKPIDLDELAKRLPTVWLAFDLGVGKELLGYDRDDLVRRTDALFEFSNSDRGKPRQGSRRKHRRRKHSE